MLVEKTKKAIGRLFNRSETRGVKSRKSSLRKLIHENLEDRRLMTAVPLTGTGTYTENFDSMNAAGGPLPAGWEIFETGTGGTVNQQYGFGTGSSNTGDTYSFGVDTDRAFGTLLSGSNTPTIGASFKNISGSTFSSFNIGYHGEQWRLGATGRADKLDFQYSTNATSLNDPAATWTDVNTLDFTGPTTTGSVGALNGNQSANRTVIAPVTIAGVNLANNQTIYIRWLDSNISGTDDGLAVDNFSLTPVTAAVPGVSITPTGDDTRVHEDPSATNASDEYAIVLQSAPSANVTINITRNAAQLGVSATSVTFTPGNWNVPQTVVVSAVDDAVVEGSHTSVITHSVAPGSAAAYLGVTIPSVTVNIGDNEVPVGSAIPLTGSPYTQNFNTLVSSGASAAITDGMLTGTLKGWAFAESGTNGNTTYVADNGLANAGNTYSYGATDDTERAFGGLASSSLSTKIGALFVNNTGSPIVSLDFSYFAERWRAGEASRPYNVSFEISTDAYNLVSGNWTNHSDLDLTLDASASTVGAVDGNASGNRFEIDANLPSLNIPVGGTFWIRWDGSDQGGTDDGWAIDDFSVSTAAVATPGVTIAQTDDSTSVTEGGNADTYTIVLESQPTSNVTVFINPNAQVNANFPSIQFTPSNWNTPRTITINAVNDTAYEGTHAGVISHTVTSSDAGYNGIAVDSLNVTVVDNENPTGISLTGTPYSQNFNSLIDTGASAPIADGLFSGALQGWAFAEVGSGANNSYAASTGSSNAGNTYSFGSDASDRALGGLTSGAVDPIVGALFTNNTGAPITTLDIDFTGEQWRLGDVGRNDFMDFQYSLDAFSLTSGTWIDADQFDWIAPQIGPTAGALDGNAAANRVAVSDSLTGLNIPAGASFWIRFQSSNVGGSDDGLAIDDFTISTGTPVNTAPTISAIADQSIAANSSTGALAFTVGDAQTPAGSLVVTAASTNTALVPVANVVFGGSGASRTVTVTPVVGQFGSSTITLTVSDGTLTSTEVFVVNVSAPVVAPKVESLVFGDSTTQRSMVKSITVTFGKVVTIDANAFELRRRVGATLTAIPASELAIGVSTATVSGKTVATLTFTGSSIIGASLSDGNYHLTVVSNKVHAGGLDLDGDGIGGAGGNYVKGAVAADNFFRLYGDINGTRSVNAIDANQFRLANGTTSSSPAYRAAFDYQSNNSINALDSNQFRLRNGTSLPS